MKIDIKHILLFAFIVIGLFSCKPSERAENINPKDSMTINDLGTITEHNGASDSSNKIYVDSVKSSMPAIATAKGTKTYYDKNYNVSLIYPDNWTQEYNQYVAFKINSPQESEKDTMKENFFYAVIDENPPTTKVIAQEPKPVFLSIEQMANKMEKEISTESSNRKNCKILSKQRLMLNGVPAYEYISTGMIRGVAMKYRIMAMKLGTRQYYLYFSAEENKFDVYQTEADMIFSSFLVK